MHPSSANDTPVFHRRSILTAAAATTKQSRSHIQIQHQWAKKVWSSSSSSRNSRWEPATAHNTDRRTHILIRDTPSSAIIIRIGNIGVCSTVQWLFWYKQWLWVNCRAAVCLLGWHRRRYALLCRSLASPSSVCLCARFHWWVENVRIPNKPRWIFHSVAMQVHECHAFSECEYSHRKIDKDVTWMHWVVFHRRPRASNYSHEWFRNTWCAGYMNILKIVRSTFSTNRALNAPCIHMQRVNKE